VWCRDLSFLETHNIPHALFSFINFFLAFCAQTQTFCGGIVGVDVEGKYVMGKDGTGMLREQPKLLSNCQLFFRGAGVM